MPKEVKLIAFADDAIVLGKASTTSKIIKKIQFIRGFEDWVLN